MRVPVFIGHGEAVNVEFEQPVTAGEARAALRDAPGVEVMDEREDGGYVTPARMRRRGRHLCQPHPQRPDGGRTAWRSGACRDNLRKGAALNAVQIAETLVAQGLLAKRPAGAAA